MKRQIGVWLDEDIEKKLRFLAKSRGISISEYIRFLILRDLEEKNLLKVVAK